MLKACGFFELESVKNISSSKLHQIVGIIIGLDPNNTTHMRSLRGNINVMNKKSEENPLKFTTSNHIEQMMKLLK